MNYDPTQLTDSLHNARRLPTLPKEGTRTGYHCTYYMSDGSIETRLFDLTQNTSYNHRTYNNLSTAIREACHLVNQSALVDSGRTIMLSHVVKYRVEVYDSQPRYFD